ncbi:hypothetical protein [Oceanibaculum indicum]|uniref:Uncharacterized protein n=1 Tax=Oceanibaculum indicum P24 TaxID=1207063 RepID=K2IX53_9PROT|nr:hypothetical protein [Oceanibaculum indicum]EKE67187.1 hypothetical protein P24_18804 [Oceanibaculum indicum P24]
MPDTAPTLTVPARRCRECGGLFAPAQQGQEFCSVGHRHLYHNRVTKRGRQAYEAAMAWRMPDAASGKRGSPTPLSNMVDRWIAEDNQRARDYEAARSARKRKAG